MTGKTIKRFNKTKYSTHKKSFYVVSTSASIFFMQNNPYGRKVTQIIPFIFLFVLLCFPKLLKEKKEELEKELKNKSDILRKTQMELEDKVHSPTCIRGSQVPTYLVNCHCLRWKEVISGRVKICSRTIAFRNQKSKESKVTFI